MQGYAAKELANAFRTVRRNTVQIAEDIPEDKYDFVAAPGARSIRDLLAHIAYAPRVQEEMHRVKRVSTLKGFDFPAIIGANRAEEQERRTKADLVSLLKSEGERFAAWLDSLSPEFLSETFTDPTGQNARTRFESLLSPKEHEMHHRGQLMMVQRILGVVPHLTREREARQRQPGAH